MRIEVVLSQSFAAMWLNVCPSIIRRLCTAFIRTESISRRYNRGMLKARSASDDGCLQLTARRHGATTLTRLRSSVEEPTGRLVSRATVRRRLHEGGLHARRPVMCLP
ncbi:hypothetical protein AVEN_217172-1 [Araneus ventricosus]|uniref:Transposase Tc1-like domain-containing protein n=1 Tax=Araneus ventricosus TaxID=182803 RepID=A0A4Y2WXX7_ARAVE|nr:hypothetical protein AVEN_96282-1 [Araneus ventricosus]GBO41706.1 hypothetical protein AVEN_75461-1 [Araneus ventricosus]GBO41707.1 hypothetical protein AVEN_113025-1 [Araneus ventricosus]GBO41708.1 hypothetical protein AVEN_217172-1 [Araneus ventricosus]